MKIIFIVVLFSLQIFAIDVNDTMDVKVLDILKNNRVSLNRGVADGLLKNSHFKLNGSLGYLARGIVIHTKEDFSIVQLYRIIGYDSFSRNDKYTLTSLKTSFIAPHMRKYLRKDFSSEYSGFIPGKSQEPNEVNSDLPRRTTSRAIQKALGN